jgi:hypothetical protein
MFNPNPAFLLVQKLKSAPKGFTLGVKAETNKKNFSICPKLLLINAELYGLVLAPRLEKKKKDTIRFVRGQFATPGGQYSSIS